MQHKTKILAVFGKIVLVLNLISKSYGVNLYKDQIHFVALVSFIASFLFLSFHVVVKESTTQHNKILCHKIRLFVERDMKTDKT